MHNCNHLPDDPKLVLAMQINEETYEAYLAFPAKTHHDIHIVIDGFVLLHVDTPGKWGWMPSKEFREMYRMRMTPLEGHFKLYEAI